MPRFLDPFGDHPPYSFTRITITEPAVDGVSVIFGQNVMIHAQTHGHRPGDLFVTVHPPGQPENAVTVPMFDKGAQGFAQQIEGVKTDLIVVAHSKNRHSLSQQRRVAVDLTLSRQRTHRRRSTRPDSSEGGPRMADTTGNVAGLWRVAAVAVCS